MIPCQNSMPLNFQTSKDPKDLEKTALLIQQTHNITIPSVYMENLSQEKIELEIADFKSLFAMFGEIVDITIKGKIIIALYKSFIDAESFIRYLSDETNYIDDNKKNFKVRWFEYDKDMKYLTPEMENIFEKIHNENVSNIMDNKNNKFLTIMANGNKNKISNGINNNNLNNNINNNNNTNKNNSKPMNWKEECEKGNLMPGIIMLEQKRINVDDEVNSSNGNTLLHYAASFGFYNAIRALIEIYNADINKQNKLGYSPLYYIVNNNDTNIFNFQYFVKLKKIDLELCDKNNLNILIHSIITHFDYAFLFFSYHGLIEKYHGDIYENPLIYFSIIYNNKFALSYLLLKKNCDINATYFNKSAVLSDILINNKYTSITKFLVKYFNEEINLESISTCKKGLLNFPFYNIFNYELLNTLYFYKTNNFFNFFISLIKSHKTTFIQDPSKVLLDKKISNNEIGYKYKIVNLKFMIYDLILPRISKYIKIMIFFIYLCLLYFGTKEKIYFYFLYRKEKYIIIYKMLTSFLLLISFIYMFFSSEKVLSNDKEIESDIVNIINNGNVIDLPNIDEICSACGTRKNLNDSHCFKCKGCFSDRFFHSNLL